MKFFDVEIYDGEPSLTEFPIAPNTPFKEQWYWFVEDMVSIKYNFSEEIVFLIDIGWYGPRFKTGCFRVDVFGIKGVDEIYFREFSKNLDELRISITNAVKFIQKIRPLSIDEIRKLKKLDFKYSKNGRLLMFWTEGEIKNS